MRKALASTSVARKKHGLQASFHADTTHNSRRHHEQHTSGTSSTDRKHCYNPSIVHTHEQPKNIR